MPAKHSTINNILASKFTQHMNDRTNNEKRRILQERLAEIKEKHKSKAEIKIATPEAKATTVEPKASTFSWIKYIGAVGVVACGVFYIYSNEEISEKAIPFKLTEGEGMAGVVLVFSPVFPESILSNR